MANGSSFSAVCSLVLKLILDRTSVQPQIYGAIYGDDRKMLRLRGRKWWNILVNECPHPPSSYLASPDHARRIVFVIHRATYILSLRFHLQPALCGWSYEVFTPHGREYSGKSSVDPSESCPSINTTAT